MSANVAVSAFIVVTIGSGFVYFVPVRTTFVPLRGDRLCDLRGLRGFFWVVLSLPVVQGRLAIREPGLVDEGRPALLIELGPSLLDVHRIAVHRIAEQIHRVSAIVFAATIIPFSPIEPPAHAAACQLCAGTPGTKVAPVIETAGTFQLMSA